MELMAMPRAPGGAEPALGEAGDRLDQARVVVLTLPGEEVIE